MRSLRTAVLEAIFLSVIGAAVGLAANGFRDRGLALGVNHFAGARSSESANTTGIDSADIKKGMSLPAGVRETNLAGVTTCFDDPTYDPNMSDCRYLFVDARNDEHFAVGHIPDAVQIDHYYKDDYLPAVLPLITNIERVILYCEGNECEDSILVAQDLIDAGVPADKLFVFKGGWEAWQEVGLPIETEEE